MFHISGIGAFFIGQYLWLTLSIINWRSVLGFNRLNTSLILLSSQPTTIKINQPDQGSSSQAAQKSACCGS